MTSTAFAVILAGLIAMAPAHAEQYLCTPDRATGFIYDKTRKTWDTAALKTGQFVIAPADGGKAAYTVTDIGDKDLPGSCDKDFNKVGMLFCDVWGGDVKFNKANGRFLRTFVYAYYNVGLPGPAAETDETSGTPMIEIGKCKAF